MGHSYTLEASPFRAGGVDLVVTGVWSDQARRAIEEGQADGLILNYARGFRGESIEFIKRLPIRSLDILARWLDDVEPIYALSPTLNALAIEVAPHIGVELERLPGLRSLSANWPQVHGSIHFATRLESFSTYRYGEADLSILENLAQLNYLGLKNSPRLESLQGMASLQWLTTLRVSLAPRLADISDVGHIATTLQEIDFLACKKVNNIAPVKDCRSLRFFSLSEGGEISSVGPIANLDLIERLYLYDSTRVMDGDLGPIASLPRLRDFRMMNRRNYKPTVKEIESAIARRSNT